MAKKFMWENVSTTLSTGRDWDPFSHSDNVPTQQCLLRIKRLENYLLCGSIMPMHTCLPPCYCIDSRDKFCNNSQLNDLHDDGTKK